MEDHGRGGEVFDRRSAGFEQGDFLGRPSAGDFAPAESEKIALDICKIKLAFVARLEKIACLGHGALARVDIDAGAGHDLAIGLAHGGFEGAGEIDMGAGLEPGPLTIGAVDVVTQETISAWRTASSRSLTRCFEAVSYSFAASASAFSGERL